MLENNQVLYTPAEHDLAWGTDEDEFLDDLEAWDESEADESRYENDTD